MDDLLTIHALSSFGDYESDDFPPDVDSIQLGYTLGMAFDLWVAWKDNGTLPHGGGYLDQPRKWRNLIHILNRRYAPIYRQAREDHQPGDKREHEGEDVLGDFLTDSNPFDPSIGRQSSWERYGRD